MCLFPLPNTNFNSKAYKKGVKEFNCGACPECLKQRASVWALRSHFESLQHVDNCMVTLTYDSYIRDKAGHIIGEKDPDSSLVVDKRDVQLFIKRLRKWYSTYSPNTKIKYLATAEYGNRTHRAHYHVILFGVRFPDVVFYKKSKRGNLIYTSSTLTELWAHGICTVDSLSITPAVARYCTKYCAKSRSENTFMLFSHELGLTGMLEAFNGRPYIIDGRSYPIPRVVWQRYIYNKYSSLYPEIDYRYVNHSPEFKRGDVLFDEPYDVSLARRNAFFAVRDCDDVYKSYLSYCKSYYSTFENFRAPVLTRILQLSDKYYFYKQKALDCYFKRKSFIPTPAPGSGQRSAFLRYIDELVPTLCPTRYLPYSPCPNTANDTKPNICPFDGSVIRDFCDLPDVSLCNMHKKSGNQLEFLL